MAAMVTTAPITALKEGKAPARLAQALPAPMTEATMAACQTIMALWAMVLQEVCASTTETTTALPEDMTLKTLCKVVMAAKAVMAQEVALIMMSTAHPEATAVANMGRLAMAIRVAGTALTTETKTTTIEEAMATATLAVA